MNDNPDRLSPYLLTPPLVWDFLLLTFEERVRHIGDELPFAVRVALPDVGEVAFLRALSGRFLVLDFVATVRVSELARGGDASVDAFPLNDFELSALEMLSDRILPKYREHLDAMNARVLARLAQISVADTLARQGLAEVRFEIQNLRASPGVIARRDSLRWLLWGSFVAQAILGSGIGVG